MKKKVFTILIAIAVLCGFAACSGGSTPDPAPARTSFGIKIERPEHGSIVLGEDCADYTVKSAARSTPTAWGNTSLRKTKLKTKRSR